jgi:hypothetical protein
MPDNPSYNFSFREGVRIELESFKTAVSELHEAHQKAHADNKKGKPIDFDDLADCPFCSINATIASNEKLVYEVSAEVSKCIKVDWIAEAIVDRITGDDLRDTMASIFTVAYAIGMKCGRNDAIAEFTGVK